MSRPHGLAAGAIVLLALAASSGSAPQDPKQDDIVRGLPPVVTPQKRPPLKGTAGVFALPEPDPNMKVGDLKALARERYKIAMRIAENLMDRRPASGRPG